MGTVLTDHDGTFRLIHAIESYEFRLFEGLSKMNMKRISQCSPILLIEITLLGNYIQTKI